MPQPDRLDVRAHHASSIADLAAQIAKTGHEIEALAAQIHNDLAKLTDLRTWYDAAVTNLEQRASELRANQPPWLRAEEVTDAAPAT